MVDRAQRVLQHRTTDKDQGRNPIVRWVSHLTSAAFGQAFYGTTRGLSLSRRGYPPAIAIGLAVDNASGSNRFESE